MSEIYSKYDLVLGCAWESGPMKWFASGTFGVVFLKVDLNAGHPLKSAVWSWVQSKFGGAFGALLVHHSMYYGGSHQIWRISIRDGNMIMLVPVELAILLHCGGPRLIYVVTPQHAERIIDRNDIIIYARRFAYIII